MRTRSKSEIRKLAHDFAPELYYVETAVPLRNTEPEDYVGLYWREITNPKSEKDLCIQYIAFFKYQHLIPSILCKILNISPGVHPNDYVPIFLYFKHQKLIKAVFDICHYEAIGEIDTSFPYFSKEKSPQFQIKWSYRGLKPLRLKNDEEFKRFNENLNSLDEKTLNDWWDGKTLQGSRKKEAEFVIKEKLINPFQNITTFRDHSEILGHLLDAIFRVMRKEKVLIAERSLASTILPQIKSKSPNIGERVNEKDLEDLVQFVGEYIVDELEVLDYVAVKNQTIWTRIKNLLTCTRN
jgi:hypothetical protein